MNILPMRSYNPKDRPWVIRMLRYVGYLLVIVITIAGVCMSGSLLTPVIQRLMGTDSNIVAIVVLVLGGFLAFVCGLVITLPYWGLAMLLDDIHAIRVQSSAYVALGGNDKQNDAPTWKN